MFGFVTIRKQEAKIKRANKDNWKAKVPFARAVMRNLIKGLSSYNILRNPEYKEAFGITWKFAVENKDVRAVRRMKAKAQATLEDEDAEKAEVFLSLAAVNFYFDLNSLMIFLASGTPTFDADWKCTSFT